MLYYKDIIDLKIGLKMLKNSIVTETLSKYGTCLVIDTKAIEENFNIVKQKASSSELSWVIKNNAYELKVEHILPIIKKVNCKHIFVATLLEGLDVKNFYNNKYDANIYILNPILPNQEEELFNNNLIPVVNTLSQVKAWNSFAKAKGKKLSVLLHIETGINRLGLLREDVMYLYQHPEFLENLDIQYIMSHFATASIKYIETMEAQYNEFLELTKYLPKAKYSLAASDALFIDKKYHFDLVRPAIVLYGAVIADFDEQLVKNVIYLYSTIQQVKTLNIGEKVGYGHLWEAIKPSKVAVLPLGYGDGIPRTLSKSSKVNISGYMCPIVGCVSMDLITVDITELPENLQKEGEIVEIIGRNISLEDFSISNNSLDCDVLNRLTTRYPRLYL